MNEIHNSKLTDNAKALRKNMTKEERHLWYDFLKALPMIVNRQKVIGKYIVDFYIAASKIAIELDGSQHFEGKNVKNDKDRDGYLNKLGIRVLRYSNLDINKNFEGVCRDILNLNCNIKSDTLQKTNKQREEAVRTTIIKDFPWQVINPVLHKENSFIRDIVKRLAFWEETSDNTILTLICATFKRGIWVCIVYLCK